jgi:hypothetical protein
LDESRRQCEFVISASTFPQALVLPPALRSCRLALLRRANETTLGLRNDLARAQFAVMGSKKGDEDGPRSVRVRNTREDLSSRTITPLKGLVASDRNLVSYHRRCRSPASKVARRERELAQLFREFQELFLIVHFVFLFRAMDRGDLTLLYRSGPAPSAGRLARTRDR